MKCSRCAAELPDSSTFCSSCGAVNPSVQVATSSFSYLPAGAPPWPASTPARSAYVNGSIAPIQAPPSRSSEKSRRSPGKIMSSILILLIPLIIGVGGTLGVLASHGRFSSATAAPKKVVVAPAQTTPAATASTQGSQLPTPTSFTSASVKDVNAALEYPAGWVEDALQKSTDSTSLGIHSPTQEQIGISFYLVRFSNTISATITSTDQVNQSNVQQFSGISGVSNVQTVPSTGSVPTIGGTAWKELDMTFMNTNNVKIDVMSMAVEHNKVYYNIVVLAPDVYYPEAMQKYIQHMFTTFKFLS
jgi:hypothetical protein